MAKKRKPIDRKYSEHQIIKFEDIVKVGDRDVIRPDRVEFDGKVVYLKDIKTHEMKEKKHTYKDKPRYGKKEDMEVKVKQIKFTMRDDSIEVFSFNHEYMRDRYFDAIQRFLDIYDYLYKYLFRYALEDLLIIDNEQHNENIKKEDKRSPIEVNDDDMMDYLQDLFFTEDDEDDFNFEEIILEEADEIIYNETQLSKDMLEFYVSKNSEDYTEKTTIVKAMADLKFIKDLDATTDELNLNSCLYADLGNAVGGPDYIFGKYKIQTAIIDIKASKFIIKLLYVMKSESWILRIFRRDTGDPVSDIYGKSNGIEYIIDGIN